jgi:Nicotinamide mononucleotide transporter
MPDGLMARLWAGLLATSPLEALAVLSSLVYVVLAVPRSRWCWVAGGVGSLIYLWLFARARLPMQSLQTSPHARTAPRTEHAGHRSAQCRRGTARPRSLPARTPAANAIPVRHVRGFILTNCTQTSRNRPTVELGVVAPRRRWSKS